MAIFTFPLVTKGSAHVAKNRKLSAQYELPTAYCTNDVCGAVEWKRLGVHADFSGRVECDDLSRLLLSYHFTALRRLTVPAPTQPVGVSYPADDAAMIAAGYTQRGPIWVKPFASSARIEYEVRYSNESLVDQCNTTYGQIRNFSINRYSFDSVTCEYFSVSQESYRLAVSDDLAYPTFIDAATAANNELKIGGSGVWAAFVNNDCATIQAATKTVWATLNGTSIVLGV